MNQIDALIKYDELSYQVKEEAAKRVAAFVDDFLVDYSGSTSVQSLLNQRSALRGLRKSAETRQEGIYMFSYEMYNLLLIEIDNRITKIQNSIPFGVMNNLS